MQSVIRLPLPLQDKNSFLRRDRTVSRRNICLSVKFGVVGVILFQNVVDGGEQHPSNGNNGLLVTSALLNRKIPIADFRVTLSTNSTERTLSQSNGLTNPPVLEFW